MTAKLRDVFKFGLAALVLTVVGASCGSDSTPPPNDGSASGCEKEYASTFEGIQDVIFEKHGCTQKLCHGDATSSGLDLSPDVAYENIFQKRATGNSLNLIEPGDEDRSYLWLKLAANTYPERGYEIAGSPMPNGLPALSEKELELVRRWIYAGAPEDATVIGTDQLLDACLPPPKPISITPLDPPPAGEGVQWVMPPWKLPAASEFEGCYATYYDFTDEVPDQFKDPSGRLFRWKGFEVRQDPESHHLLLYYSPLNLKPGGLDPHDPSFGTWTCMGGAHEGEECEPTDKAFCGEGVCASELQPSFACAGYGPPSAEPAQIVGGAPQAQTTFILGNGVYQQLPMTGVLYWNTHAFNLTTTDHIMNGRVNYYFATEQVYQAVRVSDFSAIFTPNNMPFTKETFCNDHVFPVGSRVIQLFAHTHKHGEYYWVTDPQGNLIYENYDYSDPVLQRYDPPLAFDSMDPAQRTVRYCATYNNGVGPNGEPDIDLVTRASRVPQSAREFIGACKPVACVKGKVTAPCKVDADCDNETGAGDGFCDACRITGGESTQNEMFVLFGSQYIDPTVPGAETDILPYPED